LDQVFNQRIDETGKAAVVKNYEEAYPYLNAAPKSTKHK
jgi:hypothetical protein